MGSCCSIKTGFNNEYKPLYPLEHKILLIGCKGSGKSTIFKQLQTIHGTEYTEQERIRYIPHIHQQCISQMKLITQWLHENDYGELTVQGLKAKQYLNNIKSTQKLTESIVSAIKSLWNEALIKDLCKYHSKYVTSFDYNMYHFWNDIDRISTE
eukprot:106826_1